jgi:hypothetical protein
MQAYWPERLYLSLQYRAKSYVLSSCKNVVRQTAILAAAAFLNPDHGSRFDRSFCRAVRSSNARLPLPDALEK